MDKEEFMNYIRENFEISAAAYRLIANILDYISSHAIDENEQYLMACELLDNTIGLSDVELKQICL